MYNITMFCNRSHFQAQLKNWSRMMYNFPIFDWTGLESSPVGDGGWTLPKIHFLGRESSGVQWSPYGFRGGQQSIEFFPFLP